MVDATAQANGLQSSTPKLKPADANSSGLSSDFETFLKMLTAQARYQDPLQPIDSTEYAAQLAQFSMVEQQVKTNDMLTALTNSLGGGNIGALANWVGKDGRADMPAFFVGNPIQVSVPMTAGTELATLVVKDDTGKEIQRIDIPKSQDSVIWSGRNAAGVAFPPGHYALSVENQANGKVLNTKPAEVYGRIVEVQSKDGQASVVFDGGTALSADKITGLRNGA